ncbi:MAG: DnaB-like helicase C-terminal domain-containing protein, partial [Chthonomonadales bacterium]
FSIEMSNEIVMMRAASNAARVHLGELMQAKLQPEEWDRLGSLGKNLSVETPEICETPIIRLSDIRNHCRIVERTKPVSVVVIDYLQLLTHEGDNKGDTEALKVGRLAKGLAAIAKDFNCGVIALSQLNRASETRNDKHPTLSDLRESGTIEAAADVVLGLTKSSSFTPDVKIGDYEIVDVDVLKQRNGRLGRMHFRFEGQYMTFSDCDQADYDQLENKRSPKPAAKKKPEPALNEPKSEGRFANLDVDEMMEGY